MATKGSGLSGCGGLALLVVGLLAVTAAFWAGPLLVAAGVLWVAYRFLSGLPVVPGRPSGEANRPSGLQRSVIVSAPARTGIWIATAAVVICCIFGEAFWVKFLADGGFNRDDHRTEAERQADCRQKVAEEERAMPGGYQQWERDFWFDRCMGTGTGSGGDDERRRDCNQMYDDNFGGGDPGFSREDMCGG